MYKCFSKSESCFYFLLDNWWRKCEANFVSLENKLNENLSNSLEMSLMPTYLILVIAAISTAKTFAQTNQTSKPCRLKKFDSGFVCVCTDDYCDTLKVPIPKENGYILATSSESGQRFNITEGEFNPKDNGTAKYCDLSKTCVKIDRGKDRPKIVGFGASFTGAVSTVLNKLSSNLRDCVYKSFYSSSDGLASNLMRISIGGSDCDEYPWAYNEYPLNDTKLTNFTVHPIDRLRIQQLHDLINVSENRDIKITAAVWSPPRWMKPHYRWSGTNNNGLKREYYQTYADYHLKFLDLMNSSQIPIWAISTGNEPGISQLTPFIGLSWQATNQGKWLAENLGPALKSSNHSHVQIHVLDDNRNYLPLWLYFMDLGNKTALDYASAVAVHGYLDGSISPYVLDFTFDVFEKPILYTEMSYGLGTLDGILHPGPLLGSWNRAERLTINLIDLLSHYVTAYIDWNMILNFQGTFQF